MGLLYVFNCTWEEAIAMAYASCRISEERCVCIVGGGGLRTQPLPTPSLELSLYSSKKVQREVKMGITSFIASDTLDSG